MPTKGRTFRIRDRDAPVTREGLIFRVYGYSHPPESCVCDVEYAPEQIYSTNDTRALRQSATGRYYKFYVDGGLRFVSKNYPQYKVFFNPLQRSLVGLRSEQIGELRKPEERLSSLLAGGQLERDKLLGALQSVLDIVADHSSLHQSDFGVFGSILHGFHHPDFSDLDLLVYGRRSTRILRDTLKDIYRSRKPSLANEFDLGTNWAEGKHWYFKNISIGEFCEQCQKKMIYAVYKRGKPERDLKVEFEPAKAWSEIGEEYEPSSRIRRIGWSRLVAEVLDDSDSFFIPSTYQIDVKRTLSGPNIGPIERIVSFVEEFRGQAEAGENVFVEGNLEQVTDSKGMHYQITLTRSPNYYEQALKPIRTFDRS